MRTHKNEGAICIFLTTFGYVIVVLLYNLAVSGVKRPRAITIVESLVWCPWWPTRCRSRIQLVAVAICYTHG